MSTISPPPAEAAASEALERDGFVRAGRILGDEELAAARPAADRLLAGQGAASGYGVIALDAHRREPLFRELLEPLAEVARRLLGIDVVVAFQDLVIDKPQGTATELPWHQDQAYLPLDRADALVAWVALDHADADRGCLRYVPASHRLGLRRPADFDGSRPAPDAARRPPIDVQDRPVVVAEAAAGDCWFHHPLTWHSSPANRTPSRRRAWSVWFVREQTRWAPDRAAHPYLVELAPEAGARLDPDRFPHLRA